MKHKSAFDRRTFLKTLMGAAALSVAGQACAVEGRSWDDAFDVRVSAGGEQVASNQPVLSLATVAYTEMAIATYSNIVSQGGWGLVPTQQGPLQTGVKHPAVTALRERLFVSGDLARGVGVSQVFDSYVEGAVRRFQARHGLPVDGQVGDVTYRALNVSADMRLNQLHKNLERLNKVVAKTADEKRFVMVNVPSAQIEAVEKVMVVQRHTAVVGKIDRQTPILDSKIHEIILNPFWTVPKSIIRKDIIPLMRKEPNYLTDNNIHLFNNRGQEVLPQSVDWNTDEAVGLMFRQDPGKINAMSSTKINFHNRHAVYMHDTPQQGLFNNLMRFDSSGCIRVHNVRDLNLWILQNTAGWDRMSMEKVIYSRKNTPIAVKDPVPLHFVYISAWSTDDGVVQFRDDIYHMDGAPELAFGDIAR
ncbi:MAG: Peptidoglycan-binding protein [Candidatus Tokpelaia hoelldobleri]|uniref:Peptidoglycan-binding protein n=1 Tax=Candidatus Tokpelaia hoelldobleri TaxID=1902579 RepID=A0A1U9JUC0_9HYPH|nr:MAG: Peptidoglycan-binding protein [Candidatus Tokpelaia hoelldoblerii]